MKHLILTFILGLIALPSIAQINKVELLDKNFVYFGLDFSEAKMIGSKGFPDGFEMVNTELEKINQLILDEPKKYDFKRVFKIYSFDFDLEAVRKHNKAINHREFITDLSYRFNELKVEKIVADLDLSNSPTVYGVGFIFIVESFNDKEDLGTIWCTFFDLRSKEILGTQKIDGQSSGKGVAGHWANSVYRIMLKIETIM